MRHMSIPRRSDDAILDAARRLEDQRQHHARDDLLLADAGLAIGLPGREQTLRLRVDVLARAAFGIALVFIKAVAVLLAKAPFAQENFELPSRKARPCAAQIPPR